MEARRPIDLPRDRAAAPAVSVDGVPITGPAPVKDVLAGHHYLADRGLATATYLSLSLELPLLLEGEAGVGKTELAKALAASLGRSLVRLQCYEGIDASQALYEWDYSRQLLYLRAMSNTDAVDDEGLDEIFSSRFLIERPLLTAIRNSTSTVLLIDEIDRADDEFEAFLLEVLSDFQISIPEVGTVVAEEPPIVVLTSNRTRELHDALKRRCLYHWIDYPDIEREVAIVSERAPDVPEAVSRRVAAAVARMRSLDLIKHPGVSETINWARAIGYLGLTDFNAEDVAPTLGAVLKERDDLSRVRNNLERILSPVAD